MQDRNRYSFKEWAAVCQAVAGGRQSLILRKGGIHEGRDGFRVDHTEFWLFPTEFHQQPDVLSADGKPFLDQARIQQPDSGTIAIRNYVVVEGVVEIRDEALLPRLAGLHIWSEATVHARFHYRNPLLFGLLIRGYSLTQPFILPESPHFGGCRSWVDLPEELSTQNLVPCLKDDEHAAQIQKIRSVIEV